MNLKMIIACRKIDKYVEYIFIKLCLISKKLTWNNYYIQIGNDRFL